MKIIKLPVEYIRFLNEENHVIYGRYEYWMFLKSYNGFWLACWVHASQYQDRRHRRGENSMTLKDYYKFTLGTSDHLTRCRVLWGRV